MRYPRESFKFNDTRNSGACDFVSVTPKWYRDPHLLDFQKQSTGEIALIPGDQE